MLKSILTGIVSGVAIWYIAMVDADWLLVLILGIAVGFCIEIIDAVIELVRSRAQCKK